MSIIMSLERRIENIKLTVGTDNIIIIILIHLLTIYYILKNMILFRKYVELPQQYKLQ